MNKTTKLMGLALLCCPLAVAACGNDNAPEQPLANATISSQCGQNFKLGDFAKKSKVLTLSKNDVAVRDAASDAVTDEQTEEQAKECATYLRWAYDQEKKVLSLMVDDAQADCATAGTINFVKNEGKTDTYNLSYSFASILRGDEAVNCIPNSCTYDLLLDVKDIEGQAIVINLPSEITPVANVDLSQKSGSVKLANRTNCY